LEGTRKGKLRNFMVIGKERTDLGRPDDQGYPIRGIVTNQFLYLRNWHPERWPAGNPETGYMDCDGSPTKTFILNDRRLNGKSEYWNLNLGKLPSEELYQYSEDPDCMMNLSEIPECHHVKNTLVRLMNRKLKKDGDPRMKGKGDIFDTYPYSEDNRNFYNRFMSGEKLKAGWINETDIEKTPAE
jgi:N-sulfoglucosamine sulfohydrolase